MSTLETYMHLNDVETPLVVTFIATNDVESFADRSSRPFTEIDITSVRDADGKDVCIPDDQYDYIIEECLQQADVEDDHMRESHAESLRDIRDMKAGDL